MKQNILVAGLGLIGGSLAAALKESKTNYIIGYDLNEESLDYALEHELIDEIAPSFEIGAKQSSIIILAAPISETIKLMKTLDQLEFNEEVIVTDVSSVKGSIIETAQQLENDKIIFIGGHPMAGSHKDGIKAARAHLFENAIYTLTPTSTCTDKQLSNLKNTLKQTKSHFVILKPDEHDEMTSVISHFPHLIASSLVHQAIKWEQVHEYLPELAAGGFRDITRIASSNPVMWQDIFSHNGAKMSRLLQEWINEMVTLKEFLDKNDKAEMIAYLERAKDYRDGLGDKRLRGALPSYFDIYVDVRDRPGAIAMVTRILADADISLRNIRILEIREDINAALRLTVYSQQDQEKAYELLQAANYDVSLEP